MSTAIFFRSFVGVSVGIVAACGGGGSSSSSVATEKPQSSPAEVLKLEGVVPAAGSAAGGTLIEIRGSGFSAGVQVKVGGEECLNVAVRSPSTLVCTTPPNAIGNADVQVLRASGESAALADAYTYVPVVTQRGSSRVLATHPLPGTYPEPFEMELDSILANADGAVERSWFVDGTRYDEGDRVHFEAGKHTIILALRSESGEDDAISYDVVVGQSDQPDGSVPFSAGSFDDLSERFTLSPSGSIAIINTGVAPLVNPRWIGSGRPDYIDWARYIKTLARLNDLSLDASESSRFALVEAAWRDLSFSTSHICLPGREAELVQDPVMLLRGYGYECCYNAARALANVATFLDFPSRLRATAHHVFPEFTVAGRMFLVDPDLRVRFWNDDHEPLSAWTTEITPESLETVSHYYAETPDGEVHEVHAGGPLPFSIHPEQTFRSFYTDTSGYKDEVLWIANREAFSSSDYVLYPRERLEFSPTSDYAPLQWMISEGVPDGGAFAPPVGKVTYTMHWSQYGPRRFATDVDGNKSVPLSGLPFPVQELKFYFSEPVHADDFWLTAKGQAYHMGTFSENTWTVSAAELRALADVSDLAAVMSDSVELAVVEVGMQFNPRIFGEPGESVSLAYADDSGTCDRQVQIATESGVTDVSLGETFCGTQAALRVKRSYSLTNNSSDLGVITSYGNSQQGVWGLVARAGEQAYAALNLPRTPGLPGLLRANTSNGFADWEIDDAGKWIPVADLRMSQWILLPATSSNSTRLRLKLREAPDADKTYLDYLSLIEGADVELFAIQAGSQPSQ
jgi:hypothetical protein